jgi:hypothetical protein
LRYQKAVRTVPQLQGSGAAIGESLYVIQLRHWFDAFRDAGKKPQQQIRIVITEEWNVSPQEEVSKVLQFLQLPDFQVDAFVPSQQALQKAPPPIKEETRRMLQEFFSPYNDRLRQLLQDYGFDEFQHVTNLWK